MPPLRGWDAESPHEIAAVRAYRAPLGCPDGSVWAYAASTFIFCGSRFDLWDIISRSPYYQGPPRHAQILDRKHSLASSENIRTGLVELRTSTGSVYARPSLWERLYLLWMFRNFRCLPKEVLTVHQQRLIDRLCQVAVRHRSIADSDIIGIVENIRLVPNATSASNLIEMVSSTVKYSEPRAVAAGGTTASWDFPSDRSEPARLVTATAQL